MARRFAKELKKITINMMEKLCMELGLATPNPPCAAEPLMNRHWRKLLPCAPAVCEVYIKCKSNVGV